MSSSAVSITHHFKISESNVRVIAKEKKRKFGHYLCIFSSRHESLTLFVKCLLSDIKNAFLGIPWLSSGWDTVLSLLEGSGLIPGWGTKIQQATKPRDVTLKKKENEVKSLYDNLK